MKNKLFIVLPLLLVGLVGCGNKGGNKDKTTPIEYPKWHELALQMEEKSNPNKYASALGYAYDFDTERINFALEDKYSIDEEGNLVAIDGQIAYRDDNVYNIINQRAFMVENDEACTFYKHSKGGLGFYYTWYDGIERYEFDKYGRLTHAVTEFVNPVDHDDCRAHIPYMLANMDITVTWSKKLVESQSYYLGFDGGIGVFEDNKSAKILQFPKTTDKAFVDVLNETHPFALGKQNGGWVCRSFGVHNEHQTINQSLVYDTEYITNFQFGYFTFDSNTTEITVEFTVQVGQQACVQLQFGESIYQKNINQPVEEGDYVEKVTLKYGNYVEPRAKRDYRTLSVFGYVYSVAFADQNGLLNRQNAGLIYADYSFSETWSAKVPSYAFSGCSILEGIDWPGIDAYLIYVDSYAFYNCGQYMWQLELTTKLSMNDNALSGCTAVIMFNLSKIPNNTEDPGYEAWRTLPTNWGAWSATFDNGFEGHFTYEAWDDFICECQGESEYTFAIYWEETMDSLQVQLGDLLGHTTVVIYDDAFNELKEMEFNSENHYTDVYAYQANEWIYITVTHTSTDNPDVFFTFTTH